ncbi:MAG: DUF2236 domain-containing protein [Solirubrobacteraceae bacterium]|nr:DUF2236 domain-containing protein [Solirubrobacteraceae bacterium]
MEFLKQRVRTSFTNVAGTHDDPKLYGGPAGDLGLCGPGTISWEINRDIAVVALAGTPAIVLEILHPSVIAGVEDLSSYKEDPLRRACTTLGYVLGTTFGNTEAATDLIALVHRIHGRVTGVRPDGVPYAATDPELLAWVHTCIPWMVMRSFETYRRPLSDDERNTYLAEQAVIGRMGGAVDLPETVADLEDYVATMRGKLAVTEQTRVFLDFLLRQPAIAGLPKVLDRPLQRLLLCTGMRLAPRWAQELTDLRVGEPILRAAGAAHLRAQANLIRWAFGTPGWVAMAEARAAGRPEPVREPAHA